MENGLILTNGSLDLSNEKVIKTLRATIAKGASPEEFAIFLQNCKATRLNPFKNEIWFIKTSQGIQIMTGINGFHAIANSHPKYNGMHTELEGEHEYTEGDSVFIVPEKAVCTVYRKDREIPMRAEAYFVEYGKPFFSKWGKKTVWGQMPRVMLTKCAESMALRKAFPQELNGLITEEERQEVITAEEAAPTGQQIDPNAEIELPPDDVLGGDNMDWGKADAAQAPALPVVDESSPDAIYYDLRQGVEAGERTRLTKHAISLGAKISRLENFRGCLVSMEPIEELTEYKIGE